MTALAEMELEESGSDNDLYSDEMSKYECAGDICNKCLYTIIQNCKPGIKLIDLCILGDEYIKNECNKVYKQLKIKAQKGVAFPTCISVNEMMGHYSPNSNDKKVLQYNDLIKIDLGVHIDGFVAVVAHTIILGECKGRKADVIAAGWTAFQSALRLIKVGNTNSQVTYGILKSAQSFKCEPCEGVLSHSMKQYVVDFDDCIINKENIERKVNEFKFKENQVFGLDILVSTGKGKGINRGDKCQIYKRNVEIESPLKLNVSRELLKRINKQYPTFPFTMRNFENDRCRLGINELTKNTLVQPYPILYEKNKQYVSQFKCTVIIQNGYLKQITGLPIEMSQIHPNHQIKDVELNSLLSRKSNVVQPKFHQIPKLPSFKPPKNSNNNNNSNNKNNKNKNKKNKKKKKGYKNNNKSNSDDEPIMDID